VSLVLVSPVGTPRKGAASPGRDHCVVPPARRPRQRPRARSPTAAPQRRNDDHEHRRSDQDREREPAQDAAAVPRQALGLPPAPTTAPRMLAHNWPAGALNNANKGQFPGAQSQRYLRLAVRRRGLLVTLCHHGRPSMPRLARSAALATGWRACTAALSAVSKAPSQPGVPTGRHRRGRPAEMRLEGTN